MISKQSVYLTQDRSRAVPEGDPDAKFLLVREGQEIDPELADKHDGASELIGKAGKPAASESSKSDSPAPKKSRKARK